MQRNPCIFIGKIYKYLTNISNDGLLHIDDASRLTFDIPLFATTKEKY